MACESDDLDVATGTGSFNQSNFDARPGHDTVHLPRAGEPDLMRFWPIPLYAVAYSVHKRFRLRQPRVLPRLTDMSLGEIYGAVALGHAVDIEADRLCEKLIRPGEEDVNRLYIHRCSQAIGRRSHELLKDYRRASQASEQGFVDITHPDVLGSTGREGRSWLHKHLDRSFWNLRSLWSDEDSREVAGLLLYNHARAFDLSDHDTRALVWYIAEQMCNESIASHTLIINHLRDMRTLEGELPRHFAQFTAVGLIGRWLGFPRALMFFIPGFQTVLFHLWVYRTLWGRYRHLDSLCSLEEPAKAKAVVEAAIDAHNARAREARQRANTRVESAL